MMTSQRGRVMEILDIIARNVQLARTEAGLTQADLASALGLASHSAISEIEAGRRRLSATDLMRLSQELGKPMEWFLDPDASREDFFALARAKDRTPAVRAALTEAERYLCNYVLLRRLLSRGGRGR
jgi:transcriptional regulator with XRE-family HTH domain